MKFLSASNIDDVVGKISPPIAQFGSKTPAQSLGDLLTVAIKLFFIAAGLIALLFLLRGALDWIMSSGEKEKIAAAQQRIQNAVLGLILLFVIVAVLAVLEQFVFGKAFCFGLTCPIQIPSL